MTWCDSALSRRKVPVEQRRRAEYRHLSRRALEEAIWPGVTEDEYVSLRRTVATSRTHARIIQSNRAMGSAIPAHHCSLS